MDWKISEAKLGSLSLLGPYGRLQLVETVARCWGPYQEAFWGQRGYLGGVQPSAYEELRARLEFAKVS